MNPDVSGCCLKIEECVLRIQYLLFQIFFVPSHFSKLISDIKGGMVVWKIYGLQ